MKIKVGQQFNPIYGDNEPDQVKATVRKLEDGIVYYTTDVQIGKGYIELPEENFLANWTSKKSTPLGEVPIINFK